MHPKMWIFAPVFGVTNPASSSPLYLLVQSSHVVPTRVAWGLITSYLCRCCHLSLSFILDFLKESKQWIRAHPSVESASWELWRVLHLDPESSNWEQIYTAKIQFPWCQEPWFYLGPILSEENLCLGILMGSFWEWDWSSKGAFAWEASGLLDNLV